MAGSCQVSVSQWRRLLCCPRTALQVGGIHRGEPSWLGRAGDAWGCLSRLGMHCSIISQQPSRLGITPWGHVGHLSNSACPDSLWVLVPGQPPWIRLSGMFVCRGWNVRLRLHVCMCCMCVGLCTRVQVPTEATRGRFISWRWSSQVAMSPRHECWEPKSHTWES